jgi:glycosyltransferase 2 family protein
MSGAPPSSSRATTVPSDDGALTVRISSGSLLRGTIGIAVSVVAIWILVRSVDVAAVADVLRSAIPAWIGVMIVTTLIDIGARGARWRALLAPIAALPYRRVLGYTYLGYLANNVLPARLGELVRSHALGEGEGISRTTVLGTVVVERIVDTVMVVAIASVSVLVLSVRGVMTSAVLLGLAFTALLVIGLGLGMAAHRLPGAERVVAFLERWPRIVELGRRLRDGLRVAGRPRTLAAAIALSAVAWGASITTFLAGGQAVGVELTLAQGALIATGVALATIVPSGPGFVGTFELTAAAIAGSFGVDHNAAVAMALLVHATILAVTSIGGVVAIIAGRRRRTGPAPSPPIPASPGIDEPPG